MAFAEVINTVSDRSMKKSSPVIHGDAINMSRVASNN